MASKHTPTVLTIAGFDPYGGAGIQIDTKTIHTLGGYALSAVTAITAQSSGGVKAVEAVSPKMLRMQLQTLLDDMQVDAVKIGMLANTSLVEVVADIIQEYALSNVVLDPILVSSSGTYLLEPDAVKDMVELLFPRADILTPNIPEINRLLDSSYTGNADEVEQMGKSLLALSARAILIKGGHGQDEKNATDYLLEADAKIQSYSTPRVHTSHTHGTGCVLSSAIATYLAKGESLKKSVDLAKAFLYQKLHTSTSICFRYREENLKRKEPLL